MALKLTLTRTALTNVDDPAGRWQHEGGKISEGTHDIGHYASTKRVTFQATDAQNTAMLTVTFFFGTSGPPQSITVQGAHDFNSGHETGSVSAATERFAVHIGKQFSRTGDTVTIH